MINFDINNVEVVEFGVGRDDGGQTFVIVPVDRDVQRALLDMLQVTLDAMQADEDEPTMYEPGDKHSSQKYLYLPISHELAAVFRELYQANQLETDVGGLADHSQMFCYFARFIDGDGRRLVALRRAAHFKGILKSRNRVVRLVDDTLKIVPDDLFKLDQDFDLLLDEHTVHILRPKGFEFIGQTKQAVLAAVPQNIRILKRRLPFINFDRIEEYAQAHSRAARYLASIKERGDLEQIDRELLRNFCEWTNVSVREENGELQIDEGSELAFLMVLDRRRYAIELIRGNQEQYQASNRKKIDS